LVKNSLSNLPKFTTCFHVYRDIFSQFFQKKSGAIRPFISCAVKTKPLLSNFYYEGNIRVSFKHIALSGQAHHRPCTLHFVIGDNKFKFFCTFCINSLISMHIKIGRLIVCIFYITELTVFFPLLIMYSWKSLKFLEIPQEYFERQLFYMALKSSQISIFWLHLRPDLNFQFRVNCHLNSLYLCCEPPLHKELWWTVEMQLAQEGVSSVLGHCGTLYIQLHWRKVIKHGYFPGGEHLLQLL
jgi:hypothetical protein